MAYYTMGDIQGCFLTFQGLLRQIEFDPQKDVLWSTGDLVNRGPRSLEVLRWMRRNKNCASFVLGNHDLFLMGNVYGCAPSKSHTLEAVLDAPDKNELIHWLKQQPLMKRKGDLVLVHAGLLPQWTVSQAEECCHEVERALRGKDSVKLLQKYLKTGRIDWKNELKGMDRLVSILQAITTIRYWGKSQRKMKSIFCHPKNAPQDAIPWFDVPHRMSADNLIIFGHWASLGFYRKEGILALDSGCVYGNSLTAVRLDDGKVFQEPYCEE